MIKYLYSCCLLYGLLYAGAGEDRLADLHKMPDNEVNTLGADVGMKGCFFEMVRSEAHV